MKMGSERWALNIWECANLKWIRLEFLSKENCKCRWPASTGWFKTSPETMLFAIKHHGPFWGFPVVSMAPQFCGFKLSNLMRIGGNLAKALDASTKMWQKCDHDGIENIMTDGDLIWQDIRYHLKGHRNRYEMNDCNYWTKRARPTCRLEWRQRLLIPLNQLFCLTSKSWLTNS